MIREELFQVFLDSENNILNKYYISEQMNLHILRGFEILEQSPRDANNILKNLSSIAFEEKAIKGFPLTEY